MDTAINNDSVNDAKKSYSKINGLCTDNDYKKNWRMLMCVYITSFNDFSFC